MPLDGLVSEAGRALSAARQLFGSSPSAAPLQSAHQLVESHDTIAQTRHAAATGWQGSGTSAYLGSSGEQIRALTSTVDADERVGPTLHDAHQAANEGGKDMDRLIARTRSGVEQLAPGTHTAGGQQALAQYLHGQLAQARGVVQNYTQRDADIADTIRSADYPNSGDRHPRDIQALGHDIPLDPPPSDPGFSAHPTWRYTADDLYTHEPTPGDIHQDGIGDCYLDATMAAIATANPQWIKDRIKFDDETGQFDVTLWDGANWKHIPVSQDDITTDISHHGASWRDNGQPKSALWPTVLESAYAKFHSPELSFPHALDDGLNSGHARDAMQALTGNSGTRVDPQHIWHTNQYLDQDLTRGLANHQPITISTGPHGGPLVPGHVYSMEAITGIGSDARLTLRNPWGGNPDDPHNPLITVRLGDLIGSGLTGKLEQFGTHPVNEFNIGSLG